MRGVLSEVEKVALPVVHGDETVADVGLGFYNVASVVADGALGGVGAFEARCEV